MAHEQLAELLKAKKQGADRARSLLLQAAEDLEQRDPNETLEEMAARMKGAAVIAVAACTEICVAAGYFELAHAAELAADFG